MSTREAWDEYGHVLIVIDQALDDTAAGFSGRTIQRKPRWQVEVSIGSGKRAAGRYRRQ